MAREITKVELHGIEGDKISFTCASGVAITKGTILKLSDPRTAAASDGTADTCVGVAAMDKSATDGSTRISVLTNFIGEAYASGAITCGAHVVTAAGGNYVKQATDANVTASTAVIIGRSLETASDGEVVNVRFKF